MTLKQKTHIIYLSLFLIILLTACGAEGPKIRIEDAWIRPDPLWEQAAGYFTIYNDGNQADKLISVTTEFAGTAMMHKTIVEEGIHKMDMLMSLDIPPRESIKFEPLSFHVMFGDLAQDVEIGQTVTMTFKFEKSGELTVEAQLRQE